MLDGHGNQVGAEEAKPAQIQTLYSYCAEQQPDVDSLDGGLHMAGLAQTRFNHQSVDDLMLCGLQSSELQVTSNSRNSSVTKVN